VVAEFRRIDQFRMDGAVFVLNRSILLISAPDLGTGSARAEEFGRVG
jgi:hypothetical protein